MAVTAETRHVAVVALTGEVRVLESVDVRREGGRGQAPMGRERRSEIPHG